MIRYWHRDKALLFGVHRLIWLRNCLELYYHSEKVLKIKFYPTTFFFTFHALYIFHNPLQHSAESMPRFLFSITGTVQVSSHLLQMRSLLKEIHFIIHPVMELKAEWPLSRLFWLPSPCNFGHIKVCIETTILSFSG